MSELIKLLSAPAQFEQTDLKAAGTCSYSLQGNSAADGDKKGRKKEKNVAVQNKAVAMRECGASPPQVYPIGLARRGK